MNHKKVNNNKGKGSQPKMSERKPVNICVHTILKYTQKAFNDIKRNNPQSEQEVEKKIPSCIPCRQYIPWCNVEGKMKPKNNTRLLLETQVIYTHAHIYERK